MKQAMTLDAIKNLLSPVFERYKDSVAFAYLFGSIAQGAQYPLSDIDIAVYFSETRDSYYERKLSLYADVCRALKRNDVDMVVLNTATNLMLLDEIIRYGIVLYDSDPQLREDFELKVLHLALDFKAHRLTNMGV